jgi:hypothetical protein
MRNKRGAIATSTICNTATRRLGSSQYSEESLRNLSSFVGFSDAHCAQEMKLHTDTRLFVKARRLLRITPLGDEMTQCSRRGAPFERPRYCDSERNEVASCPTTMGACAPSFAASHTFQEAAPRLKICAVSESIET